MSEKLDGKSQKCEKWTNRNSHQNFKQKNRWVANISMTIIPLRLDMILWDHRHSSSWSMLIFLVIDVAVSYFNQSLIATVVLMKEHGTCRVLYHRRFKDETLRAGSTTLWVIFKWRDAALPNYNAQKSNLNRVVRLNNVCGGYLKAVSGGESKCYD